MKASYGILGADVGNASQPYLHAGPKLTGRGTQVFIHREVGSYHVGGGIGF